MSKPAVPLPFEDSRRLTGVNLFFDGVGAVLETVGVPPDEDLLEGWRAHVAAARAALGWELAATVVRTHRGGASLAIGAPLDQLFSATEVNEWAWLASLHERRSHHAGLHAPGHPAAWDPASALHTLRCHAQAERRPLLVALVEAAQQRGLTVLLDDDALSIGEGSGARGWPLSQLPSPAQVAWASLHDIPVALVTGSNGKTTTVRLLAAMARAHGWCTGHSCTDGIFIDGQTLEAGDFSGPAGARAVLRQPQVEAAVLETARGGILRRGLAVQQAQVTVVTNVSDDHFGEYGIHDLAGLAEVKLTLARALEPGGMLVLNADDPVLVRLGGQQKVAPAWFALDDAHPLLLATRARGGATCGVRDGRLRLVHGELDADLGAVAQMPLSFSGSASYNIANLAAASLAATALGIAPSSIASVLGQFGTTHADNPGRLQHWRYGTLQVFVDYAHNPQGLRGLLQVVRAACPHGRLGLVLGQAGNREDADIRGLAAVVAGFDPRRVLLKDIEGYMRGRAAGEVAAILLDELQRHGLPAQAVSSCLDEGDAARQLLEWAGAGDVLVLPIHGVQARQTVVGLLDRLAALDWQPGMPLPTQ